MFVLMLAMPAPARAAGLRPMAEPEGAEAAMREQRVALKQLEAELVVEPARAEWDERRAKLRALGRSRGAGARAHLADALSRPPVWRAPPGGAPGAADALGTNIRINPAPGSWTQSEVALASLGRHMVAAWNDGSQPPVTGPLAFATSTDAGRTWKPGPPLPLGNGVIQWDSDPVLVADPARGDFWFAALALVSRPAANAIGIMRGTFSDTGFVWQWIGYARATRDTLPDKPWLAVDPRNGALLVSYTSFYRVGRRLTDRIEFQRSTDSGLTWSPPVRLSAPAEEGLVQGSRPATGPDGEVHVVWAAVDTSDSGRAPDRMRIRSSRDGGESFGEPVTLARVVTNFASGAPGYDRPYAINFPSIAIDRSDGPFRGRVYVAWMEAADFYADPLGSLHGVGESGTPGAPADFEVGDVVRGTHALGDATDVFRFQARRGETALFMLDSLGLRADFALGVGCDDDPFQLAYSAPPHFGRPRVALVSFPRDGAYTLSVAARGTSAGGYRVRTGRLRFGRTRGRDVRDVFVAHSQDGVRWSEPALVSDAPPGTDDWLPELAVGPRGEVYLAWYDWSDSPVTHCAAVSNTRLSRSLDGGSSWQRMGTLSDRGSEWTAAASNLVPNQGDYIALGVDSLGVFAGWADARGGTPDVYFARFDPALWGAAPVSARVRLGAPRPNPSRGAVAISYEATAGVPARIELWDIAGRRLQQQSIAPAAGRAELRLTLPPGLAAGIYLLRFTQGPANATTRVVLIP